MRFEARELKTFGEPVTPDQLREGNVYFALQFADEAMLIPMLEPLTFAGTDTAEGEPVLIFQDVVSYREGVRINLKKEDIPDWATFYAQAPDQIKHIFEYDKALNLLLLCSLNRAQRDL
jgi:hypothetical protein